MHCECGCGGRPAEGKRFIHGHHRRKPIEYIERDCGYDTPCWIWRNGPLDTYGKVTFGGRTISAHRFMYERHRGQIPEGLQIDHLCRVRGCCNPDHLEPVSCAVNLQRGALAKLTEPQVREIRSRLANGERQVRLAEAYGVSIQLINAISKGRAWKNV